MRVGQDCTDTCTGAAFIGWVELGCILFALVAFLVITAAYPVSTAKNKILLYFVQTLHVVLGPTSTWYVVCGVVYVCVCMFVSNERVFSVLLEYTFFSLLMRKPLLWGVTHTHTHTHIHTHTHTRARASTRASYLFICLFIQFFF